MQRRLKLSQRIRFFLGDISGRFVMAAVQENRLQPNVVTYNATMNACSKGQAADLSL